MDKYEIENAIITDVEIYISAGSLTAEIQAETAGGYCAIGGYALYNSPKDPWNCCGYFLRRVMEVVGVEKWGDLPGKNIRVNHGKKAIGNIIKDDWFYYEQELKTKKEM
jgi:hypothetical protein